MYYIKMIYLILKIFKVLFFNGLISMGPIMATYSGTLNCDTEQVPEKREKCKELKKNTLIAGIIFIILTFSSMMLV